MVDKGFGLIEATLLRWSHSFLLPKVEFVLTKCFLDVLKMLDGKISFILQISSLRWLCITMHVETGCRQINMYSGLIGKHINLLYYAFCICIA